MKQHRFLFVLLFVMMLGLIIPASKSYAGSTDTGLRDYVQNKKDAIILVGDSRVMLPALKSSRISSGKRKNYVFVFSNGGDISVISEKKSSSQWIGNYFLKALKKYPYAPVVFCLGVNKNNAANINRTKWYDYYIKKYPTHSYFIQTVGPTEPGKLVKGNYKNKYVTAFNKQLKEKYVTGIEKVKKKTGNDNIYFIDAYSYLVKNGYASPGKKLLGTGDGIHYRRRANDAWYAFMRKSVTKTLKSGQ